MNKILNNHSKMSFYKWNKLTDEKQLQLFELTDIYLKNKNHVTKHAIIESKLLTETNSYKLYNSVVAEFYLDECGYACIPVKTKFVTDKNNNLLYHVANVDKNNVLVPLDKKVNIFSNTLLELDPFIYVNQHIKQYKTIETLKEYSHSKDNELEK